MLPGGPRGRNGHYCIIVYRRRISCTGVAGLADCAGKETKTTFPVNKGVKGKDKVWKFSLLLDKKQIFVMH